jgi:hypothetical protein
MKWWIVIVEEFSGYDCDGHRVMRLVMAHTAEQAMQHYEDSMCAVELDLPDPTRHKKVKGAYIWGIYDNPHIRVY